MSTTFFTASRELGLRARCRAIWEAGDFSVLAPYFEPAAADFTARLPFLPGEHLLDLACGTGNVALHAARAGCIVRGIDLVAPLVRQARARAAAAGLAVGFTEGDVEALPFADASFDWVVSLFGIQFAPRPEFAAAELLRVCRPGGRIALGNWIADGVIGAAASILAQRVPPSATGDAVAWTWGDAESARRWLGNEVEEVQCARRKVSVRYPFPAGQTVDFLAQFHGPTVRAFAALLPAERLSLRAELEALFRQFNCAGAGEGVTELENAYLEVTARRRSSGT